MGWWVYPLLYGNNGSLLGVRPQHMWIYVAGVIWIGPVFSTGGNKQNRGGGDEKRSMLGSSRIQFKGDHLWLMSQDVFLGAGQGAISLFQSILRNSDSLPTGTINYYDITITLMAIQHPNSEEWIEKCDNSMRYCKLEHGYAKMGHCW